MGTVYKKTATKPLPANAKIVEHKGARIAVGQVDLDASIPILMLHAADEKNREGSTTPLRPDLAEDLRQWLTAKESAFQEATHNAPTVRFDPKHPNRRKCTKRDLKGKYACR